MQVFCLLIWDMYFYKTKTYQGKYEKMAGNNIKIYCKETGLQVFI